MLKDMTIEELEQLMIDTRNMLEQRRAEKEEPVKKKTGGRAKKNDD